ncbi:hypothetical protein [Dysgonomonas sp. Marseille-P4361]|uniref:hypothetical protein n=1 Tax=Dysgonomonas sp. Marseille-P4361 TaxID=2161820 RepID=UPI00135C3A7B|nr:hypothetical protein [Dysgonomonas sp. Marseille-P4361]
MFNEEELFEYEKDFKELNIKLNQEEIRTILDYMYSFGLIAYEYLNNENKFACDDR